MRTTQATAAEVAVLARMLAEPRSIGDVAATMLIGDHFYDPNARLLYDHLVEAFYADEATDPITVGTILAPRLARVWRCDEPEAIERVRKLATTVNAGRAVDHAGVIKRAAEGRKLVDLAERITEAVERGELDPEVVAGQVAQDAMKIATGALQHADLVHFADAGRSFVREAQRSKAAHDQGIPLGVYIGVKAIDEELHGLLPSEVLISAGEPGVGKSIFWWRAALNFAAEQAKRAAERQIATLVLSFEMGETPSNGRVAQMLSGVQTADLRRGTLTDRDLKRIVDSWSARKDIPLYFNYASTVTTSQLRALVSEAVRKHNVGFVVLDHFRMFRMDRPPPNPVDHDEEKAAFLKRMAMDLDIALVCLAHTRKIDDPTGRPRMSDLRGSGQISAFADFVNFIYRPAMYASEGELDRGVISQTDAEFIWGKSRHSKGGTSTFFFNLENMTVL